MIGDIIYHILFSSELVEGDPTLNKGKNAGKWSRETECSVAEAQKRAEERKRCKRKPKRKNNEKTNRRI